VLELREGERVCGVDPFEVYQLISSLGNDTLQTFLASRVEAIETNQSARALMRIWLVAGRGRIAHISLQNTQRFRVFAELSEVCPMRESSLKNTWRQNIARKAIVHENQDWLARAQ
jgi:hypothetical protein